MCLHCIPLFQVVCISTYFIIGWVLYRCLSVIKSHSSIILWYTRRQWMLKVCSRARDHLLQAIEAWTPCQLSEGGTAGGGCYCHSGSCNACWEGGVRSGFLDKMWCVSSLLPIELCEIYLWNVDTFLFRSIPVFSAAN